MKPMDRLNPVALITGAGSGFGAACANALAQRADGGLILADGDEAGLDAAADALKNPPERVSTLAFDMGDAARRAQAQAFIQSQYGRLDWALINASAGAPSDLVQWPHADEMDSALAAMRMAMALMAPNAQGGAIVLIAPPAAMKSERGAAAFVQFMQAAAKEGAGADIRVNAIAPGGNEAPIWAALPWFQDLGAGGGARAALEALSALNPALARHTGGADLAQLALLLLSDGSAVSGATLLVDAGAAI